MEIYSEIVCYYCIVPKGEKPETQRFSSEAIAMVRRGKWTGRYSQVGSIPTCHIARVRGDCYIKNYKLEGVASLDYS